MTSCSFKSHRRQVHTANEMLLMEKSKSQSLMPKHTSPELTGLSAEKKKVQKKEEKKKRKKTQKKKQQKKKKEV